MKLVNGQIVEETNSDLAQKAIDAQPKPLDEQKSEALEAVKQEHAAKLNQYTDNATSEERDTWKVQEEIAVRFKESGGQSDRDFLEALVTATEKTAIEAANGDAADVMAGKIIANAGMTRQLIAMAGGMKRTAIEAIEATTSIEELNTTIETLKAQEAVKEAEFLAALAP